ncbi:MAG: hypothetical protein K2W82_17595 [Candidatus Obscuribacterales bacterium]|nr:hypothetical protein [Candidatus Obscuribacterales bacterium]
MNRSQEFRTAAAAMGCTQKACAGKPYHVFDLNYGTMYSPAEAGAVSALVEMSYRFVSSGNIGEQDALLYSVADRGELAKFKAGEAAILFWQRPHHVQAERDPARWISLRDWLAEEGRTPESNLNGQFVMAATAAGLIYSEAPNAGDPTMFWHTFSLPNGKEVCPLYGKLEAAQVKALVELAAVYSTMPKIWGPHHSLLDMVAAVDEVDAFEAGRSQTINWKVRRGVARLGHKTLREWLAERGQLFNGAEFESPYATTLNFMFGFGPRLTNEPRRLTIGNALDLSFFDRSGSIGGDRSEKFQLPVNPSGDFNFSHERPLATESALSELLRDGDLEFPYGDKLLTITEKPDEEAALLEQILGGGAMANLDRSKLLALLTDGDEADTSPLSAEGGAVADTVESLCAEGREAEAWTSVLAVGDNEIVTPHLTYFSVGGPLSGKK